MKYIRLVRLTLLSISIFLSTFIYLSHFSTVILADQCTVAEDCVPNNECKSQGGAFDCTGTQCPNGVSDCKDPLGGVFGTIKPPTGVAKYGNFCTGAMSFANNILRLFFIVSGLWAFLNIVIAGFQFMQAGGDPKAIQAAWAKIWQSFVGLLILVSSFLIAAIIGIVIFHSPGAILNPTLTGAPGQVCQ